MANEFFTPSGNPSTSALASSSTMRAEFEAIEDAFDLLPTMASNGGEIVAVNSGATALEAITTTGTGSGVRATSPTLVTPVLGAATATTINGVAITGTGTIASGAGIVAGRYTPTDANNVNVGALAVNEASYMRIGSIVSVTGYGTLQPTSASTTTTFTLTLPIASDLGTDSLAGTGVRYAGGSAQNDPMTIAADAANNLASVQVWPVSNASQTFYFSFMYEVV